MSEADGARAELLRRIAERAEIAGPVAVVVAHPDDEVLGLSALLPHLADLRLIHASDGAKGALDGATVAQRFAELDAALAALDVRPARRLRYGLPDGALVEHLGDLADRLAADLADVALVITHAFEGGHPDHDACAVAVQAAITRLASRSGAAPPHLEFALYRAELGAVALNSFPPTDPGLPLQLTADEQARRTAALAAFESQRHVVSRFPPDREAVRLARRFDVRQPRSPAAVLFARGAPEPEQRWREAASRFLETPAGR